VGGDFRQNALVLVGASTATRQRKRRETYRPTPHIGAIQRGAGIDLGFGFSRRLAHDTEARCFRANGSFGNGATMVQSRGGAGRRKTQTRASPSRSTIDGPGRAGTFKNGMPTATRIVAEQVWQRVKYRRPRVLALKPAVAASAEPRANDLCGDPNVGALGNGRNFRRAGNSSAHTPPQPRGHLVQPPRPPRRRAILGAPFPPGRHRPSARLAAPDGPSKLGLPSGRNGMRRVNPVRQCRRRGMGRWLPNYLQSFGRRIRPNTALGRLCDLSGPGGGIE